MYKPELIRFLCTYSMRDVALGKSTESKHKEMVNNITNYFFVFSVTFSVMGCFIFPLILIPALIGKNPFPEKDLDV